MTNYDQFQPTVMMPNKRDFVTLVMINMTTKEVSDKYHRWDFPVDEFGYPISFPSVSKETRIYNVIYSFTFNEESYREAVKEHRRSQNETIERFSKWLQDKFGHTDAVHKVMFDKAWEDGHSEGLHRVEEEYVELDDFVQAILTAVDE
jgi:hypothetical protein